MRLIAAFFLVYVALAAAGTAPDVCVSVRIQGDPQKPYNLANSDSAPAVLNYLIDQGMHAEFEELEVVASPGKLQPGCLNLAFVFCFYPGADANLSLGFRVVAVTQGLSNAVFSTSVCFEPSPKQGVKYTLLIGGTLKENVRAEPLPIATWLDSAETAFRRFTEKYPRDRRERLYELIPFSPDARLDCIKDSKIAPSISTCRAILPFTWKDRQRLGASEFILQPNNGEDARRYRAIADGTCGVYSPQQSKEELNLAVNLVSEEGRAALRPFLTDWKDCPFYLSLFKPNRSKSCPDPYRRRPQQEKLPDPGAPPAPKEQ